MQHSHPQSPPENSESDPACESVSEDAAPNRPGRFEDACDESRLHAALKNPMPIELEIGSGKGLFLTRAASEITSRYFIGLELATKYARQAQAKVESMGLTNACFIACDAVAVMREDIRDASLAAVHVYFPDPWWKPRHKKRRVLSDETIAHIERSLIHGGELHFWTDVLDYYEEAVQRIGECTQLNGPFYVPEPESSHSMDYRTHFERRTRLNGLPVYRARFAKSS